MAIEFQGMPELRRGLERLAREAPHEVGRALFQEAQIEATESRQRTPVKWGNLRASHEVHPPKIQGNDISVRITVGGPAAPYAWLVHEDLDATHTVGQAKFLESTLLESKPFLAQRLKRRIDLHRLMR